MYLKLIHCKDFSIRVIWDSGLKPTHSEEIMGVISGKCFFQ